MLPFLPALLWNLGRLGSVTSGGMISRSCFVAALALVAAGCSSSKRPVQSSESFDAWADTFASEWVRASPQLANRLKYFTGAEQDALDRQLSLIGEWDYPYGRRGFGTRAALAKRGLAELDAMNPRTLSHDQQTTAAIIRWTLEDQMASARFPLHRYIFDQFNGLHLDMVNHFAQSIAIHTPRDVENYLAALTQVAPCLDEGIDEARAAAAEGITPPRVILERAIEQIDGLLNSTPHDNVFVSSLAVKIGSMNPAMAAADREKALAAAEGTVRESLNPAYRRVRELLAGQLEKSTDDVGVWRLSDGGAYYARQLAAYTTTNLTADEIHAIGLKEVARLEGEMETILKQLGYAKGTVNERYAQAQNDAQPPASPDPRPQILAQYEGWVRDAEKRSALLFDLRPKAPVEVLREPAFSEKTAAAHYNDPAPDGSRPGVFYLPLPGPPYEILRGRSLSYHEAVPGHHFQIALSQEITALPRYRRLGVFGGNTAYIEGWALYAERLADESGWYQGDPKGGLGYLQSMLFRARRLVADTGIHAKHWTRQQAIDYGIDPTETERYIAYPGQACAYMIGQLRIVAQREKARAAMGPKFSIREFHNVVLRSGSVPLNVLEQNVNEWIGSAR
jgi:uncharacterized protein (DUF885 family)